MNFKVICDEYYGYNGRPVFTVGKIYEVVDWKITNDYGVEGDLRTYVCDFTCEEFSIDNYKFKVIKEITNDPVHHPSHYNKGKISVADFIHDQKLNFNRGSVIKYVCRAGSKYPDKEIEDLEKAIWYINHEIKMLKGECENEN